jgi:hypothetical protein
MCICQQPPIFIAHWLLIDQGVSYSQKFRVKHGFPNYLEVAISQFGSAKFNVVNTPLKTCL